MEAREFQERSCVEVNSLRTPVNWTNMADAHFPFIPERSFRTHFLVND